MTHKRVMKRGVFFFGVYILGGSCALAGVFLISFMSGLDLMGWGDAGRIGYLCLSVGLCLAVVGIHSLIGLLEKRG